MSVGFGNHTHIVLIIIIILAVIWCTLGGAGHLFYANEDWHVRDAVLRDLVISQWPVNYSTSNEDLFLLRAPLGYYLVPAIMAKMIGLGYADKLLLGWTITGVALFFFLITSSWKKPWHIFTVIAVFISFSGMDIIDIVGRYVTHQTISPTDHLEWWAVYFQYSSMTTILYWVPNHGLPGWLISALMVRHWQNPRFLPLALILTSFLPLWSPLTAIGTLLIFLILFLYHSRHGCWKTLFIPEVLIACVIAIPIALYITINSNDVPSSWFFSLSDSLANLIRGYALFIVIELAIIPFIIFGEIRFKSGYVWLTTITSFFLFLIPLYRFGVANDFVMRVSIPLLAIIALRTAAILIAAIEYQAFKFAFSIMTILILGSVTPISETLRSLYLTPWETDLTKNLLIVTDMKAPHYYTWVRSDKLPMMLKRPSLKHNDL